MTSGNDDRIIGVVGHASALSRFAGLDGLRAVAVLAVLVYHADATWLPGGLLGVDLFFVLSGFLITGLLLAGRARDGRIDLASFWRRRIRRLVPAMLVLVAAVLGFSLLVLPEETARLHGESLAALAYASNWHLILADESYFATIGRPPLLRHLWSLAVEAQFYLVWPVVLAVLLRVVRPHLALGFTLLGALGSAAWMAILHVPDSDPSRVYFGTDTRLTGLLLGAALAFISTRGPSLGGDATPGPRRVLALDVVGAACLAAIGLFFVATDSLGSFLYTGGFVAFALLATVLVACVVEGRGRLARLLDLGPLRWIGERSYGIYLWHWPIYLVTRPGVDIDLEPLPAFALRVALAVGLAELSYRFVEVPIRRHGVVAIWRGAAPSIRPVWFASTATVTAAVASVALVLTVAVVDPASAARPSYLPVDSVSGYGTADGEVVASPLPSAPASPGPSGIPRRPDEAEADVAPPRPSGRPAPTTGILAVGDSVMTGAAPELARAIPGLEIDAAIGRFYRDGIAFLRARAESRTLPPTVVVHLGNNEPIYNKLVDELMATLDGVDRVVVVNLRVPRDWEAHDNKVLADRVARYPNAVLVDWYGATTGRRDLFWKDGFHVRAEGAALYAQLIAEAATAR